MYLQGFCSRQFHQNSGPVLEKICQLPIVKTVTLSPAQQSLIRFIVTISVTAQFWHHLCHFLIWVIAFYILHAHQMLTAGKIWNIALTRRSGSALHLRLMLWAEMSFLASSSLFHTSPRQAPFTWTFTEAVQFKRGAQGQNVGIVTQVMSHCSRWSSLYTSLQRHTPATLSTIFNRQRYRDRADGADRKKKL